MGTPKAINSTPYWDTRFAEDWEVHQGPRQSRFFARIAIECLPPWFMDQIRQQRLTLADWGCAQGDGADVWAGFMPADQIAGIDFSRVAIGQAAQRYPAIRFINADWLTAADGPQEAFDVVFSSNTLEHFHRPYQALARISGRARKAVVLALPYREFDRIDEHFFSFLPDNIPAQLANGFRLLWSKVVDCGSLPDTLWPLQQIVLVYAAPQWVAGLGLTLKDCHIERDDPAVRTRAIEATLAAQREAHVQLAQVVELERAAAAKLGAALEERERRIVRLGELLGEHQARLQAADLAAVAT